MEALAGGRAVTLSQEAAAQRKVTADRAIALPWRRTRTRRAQFYGTARGGVACRLLRERLVETLAGPVAACGCSGSAYARPICGPGKARPSAASRRSRRRWARRAGRRKPNLACAVEEAALPFPDLHFDRVLLVHGLEAAENARGLLREVWRVLKDDGRLLVVAPNRVGVWAHVESTPFGYGTPYSPGQIGRLLEASMFRVERRDFALYLPPTRLRPMICGRPVLGAAGRTLAPQLPG